MIVHVASSFQVYLTKTFVTGIGVEEWIKSSMLSRAMLMFQRVVYLVEAISRWQVPSCAGLAISLDASIWLVWLLRFIWEGKMVVVLNDPSRAWIERWLSDNLEPYQSDYNFIHKFHSILPLHSWRRKFVPSWSEVVKAKTELNKIGWYVPATSWALKMSAISFHIAHMGRLFCCYSHKHARWNDPKIQSPQKHWHMRRCTWGSSIQF